MFAVVPNVVMGLKQHGNIFCITNADK